LARPWFATTQQLCRNLRDNPDVADNMAKVHVERGHLQVLLTQALQDLDSLVYPSLRTMVEAWAYTRPLLSST
jgi:hypothetical protein